MGKSKIVSTRINPARYQMLEKFAKGAGLSVSEYLRDLIENRLFGIEYPYYETQPESDYTAEMYLDHALRVIETAQLKIKSEQTQE